jgi:glycine/D-amino acid oxidase-like deaminating enzyme
MSRRIIVVGAGITGAAVAAELAARPGSEVTVLEAGRPGRRPGSTGHGWIQTAVPARCTLPWTVRSGRSTRR